MVDLPTTLTHPSSPRWLPLGSRRPFHLLHLKKWYIHIPYHYPPCLSSIAFTINNRFTPTFNIFLTSTHVLPLSITFNPFAPSKSLTSHPQPCYTFDHLIDIPLPPYHSRFLLSSYAAIPLTSSSQHSTPYFTRLKKSMVGVSSLFASKPFT